MIDLFCALESFWLKVDLKRVMQATHEAIRGFHVGDAQLGGVRIFDARVKIQHDAQLRVSNYRSRLITNF